MFSDWHTWVQVLAITLLLIIVHGQGYRYGKKAERKRHLADLTDKALSAQAAREQIMDQADLVDVMVETAQGWRAKYESAGFSPTAAEAMVIAMMTGSGQGERK